MHPKKTDPRIYQVLFLLSLWGILKNLKWVELETSWLGVALGAAWIGHFVLHYPSSPKLITYLSPTITALGVSLLVRSNESYWVVLAVILGLFSKKLFQYREKHFFNPANFGLVVCLFLGAPVWVSPGPWGGEVLLLIWLATIGAFILRKVYRYDVSLAFALTYLSCLSLRTIWLGDPLPLLGHQFLKVALWLFVFFMISDPRSTPSHPRARIVFGILVGVLGYLFQYHLYLTEGIFFALFFVSPLTPILDKIWRFSIFEWQKRPYETISTV